MKAHQALAAMAQVFTDNPAVWTHGAAARDPAGEECPVDAAAPASFSAQGFLERLKVEGTIDDETHRIASDWLESMCRRNYGASISGVNDIYGRASIIAAARRCTP